METSSDLVGKRQKVFTYKGANQPLEVIEKGKKKTVGTLQKGDMVYVLKNNGDGIIEFLVMKLADTPYHFTVFTHKQELFDAQYEVTGTETVDTKVAQEKKPSDAKIRNSISIPIVTGVGGGIIGYLLAKRTGKNPFWFVLGGLALFGGAGYLATRIGGKKKSLKELNKQPVKDTGASVINV